jgi:hypothetical protein
MKRTRNNMRCMAGFVFGIALVIALSCVVSAFGAGSPYYADNPLYMGAGETRDVTLRLQNMVGEDDVTLRAEVTAGEGVASLTDENLDYLVPIMTKDVPVNLRIEVPAGVAEGTKYTVAVSFTQVAEEEGRMVQFQGSIGKSFDVIVGTGAAVTAAAAGEGVEGEGLGLWWVVIAVVVIVVIYLIVRLRKRK